MRKIRLGILNTLVMNEETAVLKEPMPAYFIRLFEAAGAPFTCLSYEVTRGAFPDVVTACDAYLITGSLHGVYDGMPWIETLMQFIREAFDAGIKLVGICFGHQIIAHALGGRAEKSEKGWGLGLHTFSIVSAKPWMKPEPAQCALYFYHQDQVTALPPGAERLGGNAFCPNAMFAVGDQVLGIQGHPEFPAALMPVLVRSAKKEVSPAVYQTAVASLANGPSDAAVVAGWIRDFILGDKEGGPR